ncbi:transmembrane protein 272-like isoform X1 [Hyperolius riggenbachi]|uniref:transmembrane protein 272-like isoform X1 n=1 Tax=Hyperolius riggenbachi TaxID=752182 RepID=UPI0035A385D8
MNPHPVTASMKEHKELSYKEVAATWQQGWAPVGSGKPLDHPEVSHHFVGVCLAIAVLCMIGIAFISLGALHIDECSLEKHIPIYVLVQGVVFLLMGCTLTILLSSDKLILFFLLLCMLSTFWFCWLITGSLWVFNHYTSYHGQCHDVLYLFAFWTLIVQYIGLCIAALVMIIYCCFFCIMVWACMAVHG